MPESFKFNGSNIGKCLIDKCLVGKYLLIGVSSPKQAKLTQIWLHIINIFLVTKIQLCSQQIKANFLILSIK